MKETAKRSTRCLFVVAASVAVAATALSGCSSNGVRTSASVGYHHGFYGPRPYGYYGYRPGYVVVPGPGPGPGFDRPVATPLPSGPMHDFGPSAGFDDFGGFDDFDF
jgi:hypothetical protein